MHAVGSVPPERKGACVCVCVCVHVCTEAYVCISGDLGCWSWMSVKRFASFFNKVHMCVQEQTLLCFMTNCVHQRTDIIMFCELFNKKHCEYKMCVHNQYAQTCAM